MIKTLKATNVSGDSFEFSRHFRLTSDLDTSGLDAVVNISDNNSDGASYQNTKLGIRDFDVAFRINKNNQGEYWLSEQRKKLFKIFNPKLNPIRLDFTTSNEEKFYIIANLLAAPILPVDQRNSNMAFQKGLLQFLATDPYIYTSEAKSIDIASWIASFEFPLELTADGIEMGYKSKSLFANINNEGQEKTGMLIKFKASSVVVNPKLINVNTHEELSLDFTMQNGDVIEVNTLRGKRSIMLKRNNATTNIFNSYNFDTSTFLQLELGDNLFRYDADEGITNLEVSIDYTPRMIGV